MYRWILVWAVVALTAGAAGCGGDDSDTARDAAQSAKEKAREAAQSAKEKAREAADSAKAKVSQGVIEATGGRVLVVMSDFKFTPSELTAPAGKLTVTAKNAGQEEHELVLLRTDRAADAIPVTDGQASEEGSVGEIGEQAPGKSGAHSFTLKPGNYVFICNVKGHYAAGMRGSLVVK